MKKIFALTFVFIALVGCGHDKTTDVLPLAADTTTEVDVLAADDISSPNLDTIWAEDRSYWEIKGPFEEKGRTVLYRSCYMPEPDGSQQETLSYYLFRRKSAGYDSCLREMQSVTAKHFTDEMAESGMVFTDVPIGNTPRHWYPVRKHQGKYYLYKENFCGIYLTDGALISACGDFWGYPLKSVEMLADGSCQFSYETDGEVKTAKMELIDKNIGLYRYMGHDVSGLYTTDRHVKDYDIILLEGYSVMGVEMEWQP
ncbi:MAG: hypothetical protein J6Y34_05530 [Bacteroidales bacterium]|nr:hypothetical protein [Bacteroidales bacterium]